MRSIKYSRLALGVLTLAITACAPTAPTAPPVAGGTPNNTAASQAPPAEPPASAAPTTAPSPQASAPTGPVASAPAPNPNQRVIVSGQVYDLAGASVEGALVTMRSLDASVPYEAATKTCLLYTSPSPRDS